MKLLSNLNFGLERVDSISSNISFENYSGRLEIVSGLGYYILNFDGSSKFQDLSQNFNGVSISLRFNLMKLKENLQEKLLQTPLNSSMIIKEEDYE